MVSEVAGRDEFGLLPGAEAARGNHVQTVCRRYGERIYSYDVVNEAVQPETGVIRDTNVTRALSGEAFLDLMFHTAREEAPHAQLVYNDYMSWERNGEDETHMRGVLKLLEGFRSAARRSTRSACSRTFGLLKPPVAAIVRESEGPWRRFLDEVVGWVTSCDHRIRRERPHGARAQHPVRDIEWSPIMGRAYLDLMLSYPQLGDVLCWGLCRPLQLARGFRSACRQAAQAGYCRTTATSGPSRYAKRSPWPLLRQPASMASRLRGQLFAAALLASSAAGAAAPREITIDVAQARQPLDRFFDLSVGSDYPATLIRPDARAQLNLAVDELGFRYIRFHAIFHDVLGTVRLIKGKPAYDWSGIDKLYDALLAKRIRPFVELGFTPEVMKTSDDSIFCWKGNTSHPEPEMWRDLVDAFVRHLDSATAGTQVRSWYFEVWNEPNLDGFWEKADQQAYFELYDLTARTIKAIDPAAPRRRAVDRRRGVGAGVPGACRREPRVPVDFVTTHTYGVDGGFLDEKGQSDNEAVAQPRRDRRRRAQCARADRRSRFPDLPLYFTEWSTSYNPRDPVHDSYISAP